MEPKNYYTCSELEIVQNVVKRSQGIALKREAPLRRFTGTGIGSTVK